MRAEAICVEPNTGDPLRYQPGVLPRSNGSMAIAAAWDQQLARLPSGHRFIGINCFAGLLRQFESDRLPCLLLTHGCPLNCVSIRSNVFDLDGDNIAATQLAIDGEIEHCQIAAATFN